MLNVLLFQERGPHYRSILYQTPTTRRIIYRRMLLLRKTLFPKRSSFLIPDFSNSHNPLRLQYLCGDAMNLTNRLLFINEVVEAYSQLEVNALTGGTQENAQIHTHVLDRRTTTLTTHLILLQTQHLLQSHMGVFF